MALYKFDDVWPTWLEKSRERRRRKKKGRGRVSFLFFVESLFQGFPWLLFLCVCVCVAVCVCVGWWWWWWCAVHETTNSSHWVAQSPVTRSPSLCLGSLSSARQLWRWWFFFSFLLLYTGHPFSYFNVFWVESEREREREKLLSSYGLFFSYRLCLGTGWRREHLIYSLI